MNKNLYKQVVAELFKKSNKSKVKKDRFYHKKGGYVSYGVSARDFRQIVKEHRLDFKKLSSKEALKLARLFYESGVEDQIYMGNYVASLRNEIFSPSNLGILDRALENFHTWGTIDDFCVHVLEPLLRKYPRQTFALLKRWNKSKNMWKRRASVVAYARKAGRSGKFSRQALALCENLIWDKEDLVQKGVGWCLKDVMRGDKKRVLEYVSKLRQRGVPATITLYAMRDLRGLERERILNIR